MNQAKKRCSYQFKHFVDNHKLKSQKILMEIYYFVFMLNKSAHKSS